MSFYLRIFKIVLRYNKSLFILQIISSILMGVIPVLLIYIWTEILNSSVNIDSNKTLNYLIFLAVIYCCIGLFDILSDHISYKIKEKSVAVKQGFLSSVYETLYNTPLDMYETPEFQQKVSFCNDIMSYNRIIRTVLLIMQIPSHIITLVSMNIFLVWKIKPVFLIITLISIIPSIIYKYIEVKDSFKFKEILKEIKREANYYQGLLSSRNFEIRLFGTFEIFLKKWESLNKYILPKICV